MTCGVGAFEMVACLINGGTLCIRGDDWEGNLQQVCFRRVEKSHHGSLLTDDKAEVLFSTPSKLSHYRRHQFPNIKTLVSGSEPSSQTQVSHSDFALFADWLLALQMSGRIAHPTTCAALPKLLCCV